MQHSPITHLDPEQFFTYILDCCDEKEAAGEDPFHFGDVCFKSIQREESSVLTVVQVDELIDAMKKKH